MRYLRNVVSLALKSEQCVGCGRCLTVCPHAVFEWDGKTARIADRDACMECGACAKNCPVGAISVASGVGCAYAVLVGAIRGTEPDCGCDSGCCGG